MSSVQIRITVSKEMDEILSKIAKKLGKKKSTLVKDLMEHKMYDLNIIQKEFKDLWNRKKDKLQYLSF